jgi:hypothetical protein
LKSLQRRLNRYRTTKHTTNQAIAKAVSKNEALKLLNEINASPKINPSKVRELNARILALKKRRDPQISPFNPPKGFYIWSVADHGAIQLQLLGRNVKETVLNLAHFVIKNVYHVEREQHQYLYLLIKKKLPVGKLFFAKAGKDRRECLIVKLGNEKILFQFDHEGLFINIRIYCPAYVKSFIIPYLLDLEREFASLCCSPLQNSK